MPEDKLCPTCGRLVKLKPNESQKTFKSRRYCDKKCSTKQSNKNRYNQNKVYKKVIADEERLGVKTYSKGTPGFKELAALYEGRT